MYVCVHTHTHTYMDFQGGSVVKNLPANAGDAGLIFDPWVKKNPWRRKWHPTSVFLPGKSHGQRILAGYSPRGYKRIGHGLTTTKDNSNFIFLALWHWLKYPIQDVWREVNSGPFYLVCNLKEKDFSFPFSLFFCGNDLSDWESLPLSCFTNSF